MQNDLLCDINAAVKLFDYILCFLSLSNRFYFSEAEDIQELNCNLNVKQRELTTLETNRRHQKEALRRREEDLRGTSENLIAVTFSLNFFLEKLQ